MGVGTTGISASGARSTQSTIQEMIRDLVANSNWGDPKEFEFRYEGGNNCVAFHHARVFIISRALR